MLPTVIFKSPRSELKLLRNNQSEFRHDEIKIRPIHMKLVKFIIFGGTSGSAENFTVRTVEYLATCRVRAAYRISFNTRAKVMVPALALVCSVGSTIPTTATTPALQVSWPSQ